MTFLPYKKKSDFHRYLKNRKIKKLPLAEKIGYRLLNCQHFHDWNLVRGKKDTLWINTRMIDNQYTQITLSSHQKLQIQSWLIIVDHPCMKRRIINNVVDLLYNFNAMTSQIIIHAILSQHAYFSNTIMLRRFHKCARVAPIFGGVFICISEAILENWGLLYLALFWT